MLICSRKCGKLVRSGVTVVVDDICGVCTSRKWVADRLYTGMAAALGDNT